MAVAFRPTLAPPTWRIVAAASIGNALEWFDLLVYGYLAVTLSRLFFPSNDENASLLLTLGTFGVSYLVRPIGALVLGAYADRAGRKASLLASIQLMMIGTLLMAVLPTYGSIGMLAPVGVLVARLMQGFSIGGEFGSGTSFLVEHGPERKGFFGSFQWAGQGLAAVLASAFGIGLATALTRDQLEAWGWRLPYLFGLLVGPIGFYIRRHIEETPEFVAAPNSPTPLRELLTRQLRSSIARDRHRCHLEQLELPDPIHAYLRGHATETAGIHRVHRNAARRIYSHRRIAGLRPLVG